VLDQSLTNQGTEIIMIEACFLQRLNFQGKIPLIMTEASRCGARLQQQAEGGFNLGRQRRITVDDQKLVGSRAHSRFLFSSF
jgi:hypothetical protein